MYEIDYKGCFLWQISDEMKGLINDVIKKHNRLIAKNSFNNKQIITTKNQ